jgi:hypothetical protein
MAINFNLMKLTSEGFFSSCDLPNDVLLIFEAEIRNLVKKKLLAHDIVLPPSLPLSSYHTLVSDELHADLWSKDSRVFSQNFISQAQVSDWLGQICRNYGKQGVLDVEGIGYPEIYFRLVRPAKKTDIFGAHSDGPFFSVTNNIPEELWSNWLKIWMPICFEKEANTLGFFPGSMNIKPNFKSLSFKDKIRPVLTDDLDVFGPIFFPVENTGEVVVFSPYVLHQAWNEGSVQTRVSVEFAIG